MLQCRGCRAWRHEAVQKLGGLTLLGGTVGGPTARRRHGRRGTVNLFGLGRVRRVWPKVGRRLRGERRDAAHLGPRLEGARPGGAMLDGGDVVAAEVEEVADLVVGREEALRLPGPLG